MKNKRALIPAALFVLSLIGISIYGGAITYIFFWSVILVTLMAYAYIWCVIFSIKIYQKTEGRNMVCGTPSPFYITLQNEGWFSFSSVKVSFYSSFSSISDVDDGAVYELAPHSSIKKKTTLLCRYRGEYHVGIKNLTVEDFLGLFSVTYHIKEPLSVIVAPAIIKLEALPGKEDLSDTDRDSFNNRTKPDYEVREYAAGDDMRFVNWRATAATGKLMVKKLRGEEKSGIAIIMDPHRYTDEQMGYLPPENKVIEWVLALSSYYMEKNIPVDVIYQGANLEKTDIRDAGDLEKLYGTMSRYAFRDDRTTEGLLLGLYDGAGLFGYRMLIFVVQKWTDSENARLKEINADLVPVRVYVADDGENTSDSADGRLDVVMLGTGRYEKEGL